MKKHKIAVPVVMYCRAVLRVRLLVGMTAVVGLYLVSLNLVPGAACAQAACYRWNTPTIGHVIISLRGSDVPYIPSVVDLPAGDAIKVDEDEGYGMLFAAFEGGGTTTLNGLITLRYHPEEVAAGNQYQIQAGDEFWLVWAGPGKIFERNFDAATLAYGPGFGLDLPDLTQLGLEWAPPDITSQHVRVWTVPGPDPPVMPEPEPVVMPEPEPVVVPEPEPVVVPEPQPVVVPQPDPPVVPQPDPPVVPQPDPHGTFTPEGAPDIPGYRGIISGPHKPIFDLNDVLLDSASFTREVVSTAEPWGAGKVFQLLGPTHGEVVGEVTSEAGLVVGEYTQIYMSGHYTPVPPCTPSPDVGPRVSLEGPISIYTFDPDPANPPASYEPVKGDVFHLIVTGVSYTYFGEGSAIHPNAELAFPDLDSLFNFDNAPLAEGLSWRAVITPSGGLDLLVVPEPATLVLLATGGLALLLVWRRRRRS